MYCKVLFAFSMNALTEENVRLAGNSTVCSMLQYCFCTWLPVLNQEGANSQTILRSIWQAEWILQHASGTPEAGTHQAVTQDRPMGYQNGATTVGTASQEPLLGTRGSMGQDRQSGTNNRVDSSYREQAGGLGGSPGSSMVLLAVEDSLRALRGRFPDFLEKLDERGWDCESPILKVRPNACVLVSG